MRRLGHSACLCAARSLLSHTSLQPIAVAATTPTQAWFQPWWKRQGRCTMSRSTTVSVDSASSSSSTDVGEGAAVSPEQHKPCAFDVLESLLHQRSACRRFDSTRDIDLHTLQRALAATVRAPTAYNLQPWHAIVIREAAQKRALCERAALGQRAVGEAAAVLVFVGDTHVTRHAASVLEMGIRSGHIPHAHGARVLRQIHYHLDNPTCNLSSYVDLFHRRSHKDGSSSSSSSSSDDTSHTQACSVSMLALVKRGLSTLYRAHTGTPLLTVPSSPVGYAWKQTMIPATMFLTLAAAAGWQTLMLEGFDESAVKELLGVPGRYTVPVMVCVGYAAPGSTTETPSMAGRRTNETATERAGKDVPGALSISAPVWERATGGEARTGVPSWCKASRLAQRTPRFSMEYMIRWEQF